MISLLLRNSAHTHPPSFRLSNKCLRLREDVGYCRCTLIYHFNPTAAGVSWFNQLVTWRSNSTIISAFLKKPTETQKLSGKPIWCSYALNWGTGITYLELGLAVLGLQAQCSLWTVMRMQRRKAWNISPIPEVYCHKWKSTMLASVGQGMEACLMLNTDHLYKPSSSFLCLRCFPDMSKSISHAFWLISDFRRPQSETHPRHLAGSRPLLGEDSRTPTGV